MAVGKNKKLSKGGKKGSKKKAVDAFARKEWYTLKAPSMFTTRNCGQTLVSRTQGRKIASDSLKGRVLEVNLGDLNKDEDQAFRKIKLCVEDIQGRNCLTDFHGMDISRDKLNYYIKKWQTLIEATCDVKTTDGYVLRMFALAFTKKRDGQVKSSSYAQTAQVRRIRKKMVEIMQKEISVGQMRDAVKKFIPEVIGKEIEKQTRGIFPLQYCCIRKVKILHKPKFDVTKLMEIHGDSHDLGLEVVAETEEAVNTLTAEIGAEE